MDPAVNTPLSRHCLALIRTVLARTLHRNTQTIDSSIRMHKTPAKQLYKQRSHRKLADIQKNSMISSKLYLLHFLGDNICIPNFGKVI